MRQYVVISSHKKLVRNLHKYCEEGLRVASEISGDKMV